MYTCPGLCAPGYIAWRGLGKAEGMLRGLEKKGLWQNPVSDLEGASCLFFEEHRLRSPTSPVIYEFFRYQIDSL
jgi:hypothetical protein